VKEEIVLCKRGLVHHRQRQRELIELRWMVALEHPVVATYTSSQE
jgi:hypothetical protein